MPAPPTALRINEVDGDTVFTGTGTAPADDKEFIELINISDAPIHVGNVVIILVNGSDSSATRRDYSRFALGAVTDGTNPNETLVPGAVLVVGPSVITNALPAGTLRVTVTGTDLIQNGFNDGLGALHYPTGVLTDALWYETGRPPRRTSTTRWPRAWVTAPSPSLRAPPSAAAEENQSDISVQRKVNAELGLVVDTDDNNADFVTEAPTPGAKR